MPLGRLTAVRFFELAWTDVGENNEPGGAFMPRPISFAETATW
jgi:hypothetical protein